MTAVGLVLAVSSWGCGSGATCATTIACGGDVVGTWVLTSHCEPPQAPVPGGQCDTATGEGGPELLETVTYAADLSWSDSIVVQGNETFSYPSSCYDATQCASLQGFLATSPIYSAAVCTSSSGLCQCTVTYVKSSLALSGTYTTTPEGLLTRLHAGVPTDFDYCVAGHTLTASPTAGSGLPRGTRVYANM